MLIKYKLSDLAKNLNADKNEVAAVVEKLCGEAKKPTANLNDQELSAVLDHYTKQYAVENLNAFFATKTPTPRQKAAEIAKPAAGKPASKPEAPAKGAEQKNAKAPAQSPVGSPIGAKQPQPAPKPAEPPKAPVKRPEPTPMPKIISQPTAQPAAPKKPAATGNKPAAASNNKPAAQKPVQQKPAQPEKPKGASYTPPSAHKKQTKQPPKAKSKFDQVMHPVGGLSEAPVKVAEQTRVDTRGSYVELDKFNEKYERMGANKGLKDTASNKQKISQRTQKNRRYRRDNEADKLRKMELEKQRRERLHITIGEEITVGDLALKLKVTAAEIIKRLMGVGVMATVNDTIDFDTASLVSMEIGAKVEREVVITIEDRLIDDTEDADENLVPRSPVVVVMGHVDHGKTSLLDAVRSTHVIASEAGGITQHIGAYRVQVNGNPITFLDTPGHAAFTSMRARGAQITDIAILVVAADDGIMPQTVEAIDHAKAAGVPIIVAINKMDKPTANPERVRAELAEHDLLCEEWGGDVICVPISALKHEGIDQLLEMVQLVADVKELKANPNRKAKGVVIESKLDKGRGPLATVLVQNGTLRVGDVVICGATVGRVRAMRDDAGNPVEEAGPSVPVEVVGLDHVPESGDILNAVEDERLARELVEQRKDDEKQSRFEAYQKVTLENLFSQIEQGDRKELPIIVEADVNGSVEAIKQSLEKLSNEEVCVRVIHGAVGAVTESDVMLASASNAIIVGFNVRPEPSAYENAQRDNVQVRLYRIIYDAINDVETAMKGMLAPKYRDVDQGSAEVRMVYKISSVGTVAGCYVTEGKITRDAHIRVVREGIVVADDKLSSLKRFKDDVKEVAQGYECGMSLEKFNDIREGDMFEAYIIEEYRD